MSNIEIFVILLGAFCFVALLFNYNDDEWPNPTD